MLNVASCHGYLIIWQAFLGSEGPGSDESKQEICKAVRYIFGFYSCDKKLIKVNLKTHILLFITLL